MDRFLILEDWVNGIYCRLTQQNDEKMKMYYRATSLFGWTRWVPIKISKAGQRVVQDIKVAFIERVKVRDENIQNER